MAVKSVNGSNVFGLEGSRREALGHFLRERRAEIAPDEVGESHLGEDAALRVCAEKRSRFWPILV